MITNKKRWSWVFGFLIVAIFLCYIKEEKVIETKLNPVPLFQIKELAEHYKPIVVFDSNTLFYPVKFDGLKKVALEIDKEVVAELAITDSLKMASNKLDNPIDLFNTTPTKNSFIYYYSLSTKPEQWQAEKIQTSFPDTLSLYVNATYDEFLKITYTVPFEGNQWRNHHRGDGAMFAIFFAEKEGSYKPIKTRAYMHLQYSEIAFEENVVLTTEETTHPIFFISSGSHSTYHRPREYKDVDGIPILNTNEKTENDYAYCSNRTQLVFTDATTNTIEKWAFQGDVYWGGSPNDRIYSSSSLLGKIPVLKNLPLGNKSAKMTSDPSAVFDKRNYVKGEHSIEELIIDCQ